MMAFICTLSTVIPGPVPGTHDLPAAWVFMGGRDKPGHDGVGLFYFFSAALRLCVSPFGV
jgi:hypothetical protein